MVFQIGSRDTANTNSFLQVCATNRLLWPYSTSQSERTNVKANAKQNSGQKLGTRNTVSFFAAARHCPEQNFNRILIRKNCRHVRPAKKLGFSSKYV